MDTSTSSGGGFRKLCLAVDLEGYRDLGGPQQQRAQQLLVEALDTAAGSAGLARSTWDRQDAGDGENAVLPVDVSDTVVIDRLPSALDTALRQIRAREGVMLRARLALHVGLVSDASLGKAGEGVVEVRSIVDAGPVKAALRSAPTAHLLLALSERLYSERVLGQYTAEYRRESFLRVRITDPKYAGTAYVLVPGVDPADLRVAVPETESDVHRGRVIQSNRSGGGSIVTQAGRDATISFGNVTAHAGPLHRCGEGCGRG